MRLRLPSNIFYGWWIVAVGFLITGVGSLYNYGFTVFFLPLSQELGLSRASTSLVFSVARLEGGLEGPLSGWLIDRLGARVMVFAGAAIAGIGFIILSTIDSFTGLLLTYICFISLGFYLGFFQALVPAANTWFIRRRTMAISIIASGSRIGAAVIIPILAAIVVRYGWRTGAFVTGVTLLVVILPLSLVIRRSPESMGLRPDGAPAHEAMVGSSTHRRPSQSDATRDFALGQALRTPSFWLFAVAHSLRTATWTGLLVHFVPIFVWKGFSETAGASMIGLIALVGFPCTLFLGWMADRVNKHAIMMLGTACNAIALTALFAADQFWMMYALVALMAVGESIGPVSWSILGDLFGRKRFATLRGFISAFSIIAVGMPVVVGRMFDATLSYGPALLILSACSAAATVMYLLLSRARPVVVKTADAAIP